MLGYIIFVKCKFFIAKFMEIDTNIVITPEVDELSSGVRLDKFLAACAKELSRSQIQRLIEQGMVSCDDNLVTDNAYKVKIGDAFQIEIPPPEEPEPIAENIPLDVVFEDDDLIVVNKPAGMTVHPAPGAYHQTLVNALLFHCQGNLSGVGGVKRPGIVHRIDKDTSGLLVVAKNDFTHRGLAEQFAAHSIERTYHAVVYGIPNPLSGRIEGNIGRSRFDRKKMAVLQSGGKHAVTNYKTLKVCSTAAALVQCNLETGRTHQIRVHLSSIGCSLIGDKLYVKSGKTSISGIPVETKEFINYFPRQALHAKSLGFVHPRLNKFMQFDSSYPEDFSSLLQILHLI